MMNKGTIDVGRADALYEAISSIAYVGEDYFRDDNVEKACKKAADEAFLMVCKFFGIKDIKEIP